MRHGRSDTTNLSWDVDARELARALHLGLFGCSMIWRPLRTASPYWLQTILLRSTRAQRTPRGTAVIAAGTGLGEAGLYWNGQQHLPFAGEGGHASFAPSDSLQIELLRFLCHEFGHVSWERVLSGQAYTISIAFYVIPAAVRSQTGFHKMQQDDPSAVISQAALADTSPLCRQALDLFVVLYGAEAGNLALKLMATAGVYIGGGIAPKLSASSPTRPSWLRSWPRGASSRYSRFRYVSS